MELLHVMSNSTIDETSDVRKGLCEVLTLLPPQAIEMWRKKTYACERWRQPSSGILRRMTGRHFADPSWTVADRSTLRYITAALADRAGRPARRNGWTTWRDRQASHRWLLPSWDRLQATSEAAGVGFFGQLRTGGADAFPSHLEPRVAETAAQQGWLLAYLNVRFEDGPVYANLVVVTERAAVHTLAHNAAHTEAVLRAAATYESIRIHRLTLAGPPASRPPIEIQETLYIDYRFSPPRREVRVA